jgi:hypothetical protein
VTGLLAIVLHSHIQSFERRWRVGGIDIDELMFRQLFRTRSTDASAKNQNPSQPIKVEDTEDFV